MHFCSDDHVKKTFYGKRVAVVGSGPGCLDNVPGYVDSFDVVVRVNNFRLSIETGYRTDVHYSFFGTSITKSSKELQAGGVKLIMCKCPDTKFMDSEWHTRMGKEVGVDWRYIYRNRRNWWFCPTYVPPVEEFAAVFDMLQQHIPSTGFSALHKVLQCEPAEVYATGFDFFSSRVHNVIEPWRPGNPDDPIGHRPDLEREWLRGQITRVHMDPRLSKIME